MVIKGFKFRKSWLCKFFREEVIQLTLGEVEYLTGIKAANLSSFERGKKESCRRYVDAYEDMGLYMWFETLTCDRAALLHEIYTGAWAIEANNLKKGCIPIRMEGYYGTQNKQGD